MAQADNTRKAIEGNGFVTTAGLANCVLVGAPPQSVNPILDQIEVAGLQLARVRGVGGRTQFVGKRMRRAA